MNFKIFLNLCRVSIKKSLIYRGNSLITFYVMIQFFMLQIMAGFVFYSYTDSIAGFSRIDYFNLIVTSNIITSAYYTFFEQGYNNIYDGVYKGEIDYMLIKPVNSFWYNVFYGISLQDSINLVLYTIIQIYLIYTQKVGIISILLYIIFVIVGVWYVFLLNYLILMLVFRFEKIGSLLGVPEMLGDLSSKPKKIYPAIIQFFFIYIISFFMVYNTPVDVLSLNIDNFNIISYCISTTILSFIVYVLWFKTLKWYQSAN